MRTLRQWSAKDLEECIRDYPTTPAKELAERFSVSLRSMQSFLNYHGVKGKRPHKTWTIREREQLRRLYPTHSNKEMAGIFGVSERGLRATLTRFRISVRGTKKPGPRRKEGKKNKQ